ncbi:MAG: glycerophosphodiester phosphodiesterase family protein [Oscillospiraceae bacterium]|jgi:glycerophosphoryl diester phosphodiesterase|nr:glycerophosphodiester phosphodiesterase family protein [Oscillospiraceae bacterium]
MKACSKYLFFILLLAVLAWCSAVSASAEGTAAEKAALFQNPKGRVMSAANKGDWHAFPENSVPAIQSAAQKGADIVKIDIRQTKDGTLVLFADETVNRMCYPTPQATTYLKDLTFEQLSQYTLRSKQGDALSQNTEYKVPTLEQALASSDTVLFMLDFDWGIRSAVYEAVKESGKLGSVIFLTRTSAKNAAEWRGSISENIMTMGYHKSNVVFLATSYVKNYLNGGDAVWLATKNPYGMNFQKVVTGLFEAKGRAVASPAMPELCGRKTDCETWWNDLVARGFSVIITDYPAELSAFIQKSLAATEKLAQLNEHVNTAFHLPEIQADIFTQYKRNFNAAKSKADTLLSRGFAGEQELDEAYYSLQRAMDDVERNFSELQKGKSGLTLSTGRVLVAILAAAAVVSAQVYTHKKMKKPKAAN